MVRLQQANSKQHIPVMPAPARPPPKAHHLLAVTLATRGPLPCTFFAMHAKAFMMRKAACNMCNRHACLGLHYSSTHCVQQYLGAKMPARRLLTRCTRMPTRVVAAVGCVSMSPGANAHQGEGRYFQEDIETSLKPGGRTLMHAHAHKALPAPLS